MGIVGDREVRAGFLGIRGSVLWGKAQGESPSVSRTCFISRSYVSLQESSAVGHFWGSVELFTPVN